MSDAECTNLQQQQLYLITASFALAVYAFITAASTWYGSRIGRNQDLLVSSFMAVVVCVFSAYVSLSNSNDDPTGLNVGRLQQLTGLVSIPLFLSVLFCSLGSLHRYCSYMQAPANILVRLAMSIVFILLTLACIVTQIYNVIGQAPTSANIIETFENGTIYACNTDLVCETVEPSSPSLRTIVTNLTIGIPLLHLIFGFWLANTKLKAPGLKFKTFIQRIDYAVLDILGFNVPAFWFIYIVILLQPTTNYTIQGQTATSNTSLQSTGLLGCIYLLCHTFVLYAEMSIPSSHLALGSEEIGTEEMKNNNFFIATVANGQVESNLNTGSQL
jgi:hypothetical protein